MLWSIDWKKFQRISTSFLGVLIKSVLVDFGDQKKAKNLKNWTLTPEKNGILDWAVLLHVPYRIDYVLSNEHILRSTGLNMRHRMTKKYAKSENREPIFVPIKIREFASEKSWNSTHLVVSIFKFIFVIDKNVRFYSNFACIWDERFFSIFEKISFLFNLIKI